MLITGLLHVDTGVLLFVSHKLLPTRDISHYAPRKQGHFSVY